MNPQRPGQINIQPRKIDFGFNEKLPYQWYQGNPAIFALCNAISITFPIGEQFFIDSVRAYKDKVQDSQLREDMAGFIAQEAMHSRQHELCNRLLKAQHKNIVIFEKLAKLILDFSRTLLPARTQLAISCALEHFTALFANELLSTNSFKNNAHPVYAKLWIWHALEELEHKAVCYDVYQHVAGGWLGYIERCLVMLITSIGFLATVMVGFAMVGLPASIRRARSPNKGKSLLAGIPTMLFQKKGLGRRILIPYLAYYLPFFHPWKQDNSQLIMRWKADYENGLLQGQAKASSETSVTQSA